MLDRNLDAELRRLSGGYVYPVKERIEYDVPNIDYSKYVVGDVPEGKIAVDVGIMAEVRRLSGTKGYESLSTENLVYDPVQTAISKEFVDTNIDPVPTIQGLNWLPLAIIGGLIIIGALKK